MAKDGVIEVPRELEHTTKRESPYIFFTAIGVANKNKAKHLTKQQKTIAGLLPQFYLE